uniref:CBFD_NFYB_HMF domain-containing protein n=1 Tax=Rhabditophanes sp. KR3021 TaxID=114890 RepID=A0AC35TZ21_9BILA
MDTDEACSSKSRPQPSRQQCHSQVAGDKSKQKKGTLPAVNHSKHLHLLRPTYETADEGEPFFQRQMEVIKYLPKKVNKNQALPLARVKKIMKMDEIIATQMISSDVPLLLSKGCEILIEEIVEEAYKSTLRNKRKTIQKNDVAIAIKGKEHMDFLIDIVPREWAVNDQKSISNKKKGEIRMPPPSAKKQTDLPKDKLDNKNGRNKRSGLGVEAIQIPSQQLPHHQQIDPQPQVMYAVDPNGDTQYLQPASFMAPNDGCHGVVDGMGNLLSFQQPNGEQIYLLQQPDGTFIALNNVSSGFEQYPTSSGDQQQGCHQFGNGPLQHSSQGEHQLATQESNHQPGVNSRFYHQQQDHLQFGKQNKLYSFVDHQLQSPTNQYTAHLANSKFQAVIPDEDCSGPSGSNAR